MINNELGEFYNVFSERLNRYLIRKVGEIAKAGANVIFERGLWSSKDRKAIRYYYKNECRSNIGYDELNDNVSINNKVIVCTGCTTGSGNLCKSFTKNNNAFIAPYYYIDGKSSLLFVINFFYYLSNNCSIQDSYNFANKIDSETALYKLYK